MLTETYFWGTLAPMLLTAVMFVLEAIEEVYCPTTKNKMSTCEKVLTILLSPIWPILILAKSSWKQYCYEASSTKSKEDKKEIEKLTILSSNAHLIEVSVESSLQPLVQLHVILKQICMHNNIEGQKTHLDWSQAMEEFWKKDLLSIIRMDFRNKQIGFNPQVFF